jgi:hypothetical protein
MVICFKFLGRVHCFFIPIYEFPIPIFRPHPPGNYDELIQDVAIIGSLLAASKKVADGGVREALQRGISAATEAAQKRAGEYVVSIKPAEEK